MAILEVENLSITFKQYTSRLKQTDHQSISNLNVSLEEGEVLAIVGASGSGKSLLAHAILGILPSNSTMSGSILYKGERLSPKRQAKLRGKEISLVPQSVNFLNPLIKIGKQVRLSVNNGDSSRKQREIFKRYRLNNGVEKLFPFQLSGGMARRALLSTALVSGSKVIIADEPTPGLDTQVVEEALKTLREVADSGCAVMMITHDIESALKIADKIAVFYAGTTVEIAPVEDFNGNGETLRHPYSKALWRALPENGFIPIPGSQPNPSDLPTGCVFEPRCEHATSQCRLSLPEMRSIRDGMVRCMNAT